MGVIAGATALSAAAAAAQAGNAIANGGGGGGGGGFGGTPFIRNLQTPLFRFGHSDDGSNAVDLMPTLTDALNGIDARSAQTSNELLGIQNQLTPGFGALTDATRNVFANARAKLADARLAATSDLRGNLEKRRILGSSFANDSLARTDAQYAKAQNDLDVQEAQLQAQNKLQELNATVQLIGQRSANDLGAITSKLGELNIVGDAARSLATGTQAVMGQLAATQAEIAAKLGIANATGTGQAIGLGLNALSNVDFSKIFGSGIPTGTAGGTGNTTSGNSASFSNEPGGFGFMSPF